MPTPLTPAVPAVLFARLAAEGQRRGRLALEPLALAIERQAKINVNGGAHAYGTPTPARAGSGPGLISGTLRRALTHTPVKRIPVGWTTRVGTGTGFYPTYRTAQGRVFRSKTSADVYGEILEVTGVRGGARYPFLEPAFRFGVTIVAPQIYREKYGTGWTRLV